MSVLVGVSPGRRSVSVVQLGEMLARSFGQKLVIAAVTPRSWPATARPVDAEWLAYADASANAVLDHAAASLAGDVTAEFVMREASSVRRGMLDLVAEHSARVLVLGSSTDGPIGRISVGSEADGMLHSSPVAVAMAPRGYRTAPEARIRRITVAHQGADWSAEVVDAAASLASMSAASLRLASFAVVPAPPVTARVGRDAEEPIREEGQRQMTVDAQQLLASGPGVRGPLTAETTIGIGDSWPHAVDDIGWSAGDVLMVGSSALGPITRVFIGSSAAKLVRHSPVPVVVIPRGGAPTS